MCLVDKIVGIRDFKYFKFVCLIYFTFFLKGMAINYVWTAILNGSRFKHKTNNWWYVRIRWNLHMLKLKKNDLSTIVVP